MESAQRSDVSHRPPQQDLLGQKESRNESRRDHLILGVGKGGGVTATKLTTLEQETRKGEKRAVKRPGTTRSTLRCVKSRETGWKGKFGDS